jgi:predicted DNA-binding transcriptional regulator AlpA
LLDQEKIHVIINQLGNLQDLTEQLATKVEMLRLSREHSIGDWLPEREVLRITGLGRTTLYNLRNDGKISSSTISGKGLWYRMTDIEKIINANEQNR